MKRGQQAERKAPYVCSEASFSNGSASQAMLQVVGDVFCK